MLHQTKLLLSIDETATAIGYQPQTLRNWIRCWEAKPNGKPPLEGFPLPRKPGHFWQWRTKDVEAWVDALPPGVPVPSSPAAASEAAEEAEAATRRGRGRPRKLGGEK